MPAECYSITGLGLYYPRVWSGSVNFCIALPLLVRLMYVVALALAHWMDFVSLKNIKVVSVGGLARAIVLGARGRPGA